MEHLFREHFDAVQKADELDSILWNLCKDYVNKKFLDENTYMEDWAWVVDDPNVVSIDIGEMDVIIASFFVQILGSDSHGDIGALLRVREQRHVHNTCREPLVIGVTACIKLDFAPFGFQR